MSAPKKPAYWADYCDDCRHLWVDHGDNQCGVEDVTKLGEYFTCDCTSKEPNP